MVIQKNKKWLRARKSEPERKECNKIWILLVIETRNLAMKKR